MPLFRRRRDTQVVEPEPPRPLTREEVAARLGTAADRLLPAVRYATKREPDAGIDVALSKAGGAPDLPKGTVWPMWTPPDGERQPLQFFAQVNLADACAAAPGPLGLPGEGQLSFFAHFGLRPPMPPPPPEAATILYSEPDSQFVRCALRLVPLTTGQLAPVGMWSAPLSDREYDLSLGEHAPERYQITGRHQLGGHAPAGHDLDPDEVPLLQLDADETLELEWQVAGAPARLLWTIGKADLAARNWSACRFRVLQG